MGSVDVEIAGRSVGQLIGPKGATIKQLQSDYNVRISVSKDDDFVSFHFLRFCCQTFLRIFYHIFHRTVNELLRCRATTKTFKML